jgi:hypothetical protein
MLVAMDFMNARITTYFIDYRPPNSHWKTLWDMLLVVDVTFVWALDSSCPS